MKHILKIILLVMILSAEAYGQSSSGGAMGGVTWMRYYDPSMGSWDVGRDVKQTFDGGYIIAGNTSNSIVLVKTNYLGILEWQKFISNSSISTIIQTNDSGYVLIGNLHSSSRLKLVKTNKFGDTLWSHLYTQNGKFSKAWSGKMTNDNGFIMCGEIYPNSPNEVYIVKTDSLGVVQWEKTYNGLTTYDIIQSPDNFYYTVGFFKLRKINHSGEEIWSIPIGSALKILLSNDSFLYTVGGQGQFHLTKINTDGTIIFQRNYFSNAYGEGMCFDQEGNLILTGGIETDTGTNKPNIDILLSRFDTSGNYKNSNVISLGKISGGQPTQESIVNVKLSFDGGFVMIGSTNFPNGGDLNENMLCIKTDSLFNTSKLINIRNSNTNLIKNFELFQNYPNPFNSSTVIYYLLNIKSYVKLIIYDVNGKLVNTLVNSYQYPGEHKIIFKENYLSSGIYFINLISDNYSSIKKIILLK